MTDRLKQVWCRHRWLALVAMALVLLVSLGELVAGVRGQAPTRAELLERIPDEPDILINVGSYDMPSTSDLVLLGSRATPALVNCLVNNLDEYARQVCAQVLAANRDSRAIEPLIAALDDPNYGVRRYAIRALSKIEARTATPHLLEALKSDENRALAIQALGRSGDPAAVQPLFDLFTADWNGAAQVALWDMRRQLTPEQLEQLVVGPLLAAVKIPPNERNWNVVGWSIERAGELKMQTAVDPMLTLYEDAPYWAKNRFIYNFGVMGDARAIPVLEKLVDTKGEARLLNNVLFALQRLNHDIAPTLRSAITDRRAYIRYNAAFVAGDVAEKAVVGELVEALEDPNDIVRSEAARALGRIADPRTKGALVKASKGDHPIVRRDALIALLKIDYAGFRDQALVELETTTLPVVRSWLLEALGEGDIAAILPKIFVVLDPSDWEDRSIGLGFLGRFSRLDNPEALAFLVRAASNNSHEAFKLLARFADERTAFLLEPWLAHPGGEAEQIMRALARLAIPERKALAKRFFEQEGSVAQLYAAYYYAEVGDPAGIDLLLTALEVAPVHIKRNVATILTELDFTKFSGAQQSLEALLSHPDAYVRLYAARPLAHRGIDSGTGHLRTEIDKKIPFIRDEVIDIVDRLPPKLRKAVAERWISEVDPMLRRELDRMTKP